MDEKLKEGLKKFSQEIMGLPPEDYGVKDEEPEAPTGGSGGGFFGNIGKMYSAGGMMIAGGDRK